MQRQELRLVRGKGRREAVEFNNPIECAIEEVSASGRQDYSTPLQRMGRRSEQRFGTVKEAVSILGEYLKDDPWLRLLCSHLKLDLNETIKESPRIEDDLLFPEKSVASSHPPKGKGCSGTTRTSNGKQSKKLKAETDSHNIKDMFRKISRRAP